MGNGLLPILPDEIEITGSLIIEKGINGGYSGSRTFHWIARTDNVYIIQGVNSDTLEVSGGSMLCSLNPNSIAYFAASNYTTNYQTESFSLRASGVVDGTPWEFYHGVSRGALNPVVDAALVPYENSSIRLYRFYQYMISQSQVSVPIIYIPINSTLSGPESAASGETVNVSVSFPDGYIYRESGTQVYNKDGAIPFTYMDGTLSFTMP